MTVLSAPLIRATTVVLSPDLKRTVLRHGLGWRPDLAIHFGGVPCRDATQTAELEFQGAQRPCCWANAAPVLDVGCGTGLCLPMLRDKVGPSGTIVGIDASEQMLQVAADRSTANKIVCQALVQPGDIVLVDRNCHQSHHYGLMLSGAHVISWTPTRSTSTRCTGPSPSANSNGNCWRCGPPTSSTGSRSSC